MRKRGLTGNEWRQRGKWCDLLQRSLQRGDGALWGLLGSVGFWACGLREKQKPQRTPLVPSLGGLWGSLGSICGVPKVGLEPTRGLPSLDFESSASANSATSAGRVPNIWPLT